MNRHTPPLTCLQTSGSSASRIAREQRCPRAFARAELLALLTILALIGVLLAVAFPDSRHRARLGASLTNLQRLGAGAADYAQDNADAVYSFTWRAGPGRMCEDGYNFGATSTDLQAAADQAVCIMRNLSGRTDIVRIDGWIPHLLYNHLPLIQYMGESLPSPLVVSPGDQRRLLWQKAIQENPSDPNTPYFALRCRPGGSSNAEKRWPYSSSYEIPPAFFSPDAQIGGVPTISQGPAHNQYNTGTATPLGRRVLSEIRFPSQKAMLYETNQRFFGQRELFFMYPEVRVPVLTADGSASVRSILYANQGFNPAAPFSSTPTRVAYTPDTTWESPTRSGATSEFVNGVIRWTRSGLRGRDFGGPEVPWVP